jgi:alginate O-acetyltransferase complex protein AlgI
MWASTFFLTCVGWVFFRAKTMNDAWYILTHFMTDWDFGQIATEQFLLRQLPVAIVAIAALEVFESLRGRFKLSDVVLRLPLAPRWALYATAIYVVVLFGVFRQTQFIYFQF